MFDFPLKKASQSRKDMHSNFISCLGPSIEWKIVLVPWLVIIFFDGKLLLGFHHEEWLLKISEVLLMWAKWQVFLWVCVGSFRRCSFLKLAPNYYNFGIIERYKKCKLSEIYWTKMSQHIKNIKLDFWAFKSFWAKNLNKSSYFDLSVSCKWIKANSSAIFFRKVLRLTFFRKGCTYRVWGCQARWNIHNCVRYGQKWTECRNASSFFTDWEPSFKLKSYELPKLSLTPWT